MIDRFLRYRALPCALVLLGAIALGCTSTGMSGRRGATASDVPPDSLYTQMKTAFEADDFPAAAESAREFVTSAPDDPRADEAYTLGAEAAYQAEDYTQSVRFAEVMRDDYTLSPYWESAMFTMADAYRELDRNFESAEALSILLVSPLSESRQAQAVAALREVTDKLSVNELERLVDEYPASPVTAEMSLGIAKREVARGNYNRAYDLLGQHLYQFPQHKDSPEVRQLLKIASSRRDDPEHQVEYVDPYKVGVILPLTGKYSRFGRYFEQGATLAVDEYNDSSMTKVTLVRGDTRGDPVDAVGAIRKLAVEEGVIGVVGEIFSVPTIGAAIEANAWRLPMLSPVISEQRIDEVGPWIFQTKVAPEIEVSAIAKIAVEDLLIQRFAVLSPSSPARRKLAEYFIEEVTHRGGEIVAQEYYISGATDFRDQLEIVRQAAPEALFVPGDPEELMLLLPQVSFYDLQIQLLGMSDWNSDKLLRLSKRELEGALFPAEAFFGKDRMANEEFLQKYKDRFGGEVDEVHPIASAGYFGMRLLLESVSNGSVERRQVKDYLQERLASDAEQGMVEANSLSILKVDNGRVREFTAHLNKEDSEDADE